MRTNTRGKFVLGLPVGLAAYTLLYVLLIAGGSGPLPPVSQLLDNLVFLFWCWAAGWFTYELGRTLGWWRR
jgi:hypothetical protein